MKRTFRYLCIVMLLVVQVLLCLFLDQSIFSHQIRYQTYSENKQNQVVVEKKNQEYHIMMIKNDKIIRDKNLKQDFQQVIQKDTQWIGNTYVMLLYMDGNGRERMIACDFTKEKGIPDENSLSKASQQSLHEYQQQEKKALEKRQKIKTEVGYSLTKANTVAITFNYGENWKDTGIPVSFMTFISNHQLRLSEESFQIDKAFSYFYYCDSRGYLNYTYSLDAGDTWHLMPTDIAAFNTLWFQSKLTEHHQPYFFIADNTYGSQGCLVFYTSQDNGNSYHKHPLALQQDMNNLSGTLYAGDGLMLVSFYNERELYISHDDGASFEAFIPSDSVSNYYDLQMKDGVIQVKGRDIKGHLKVLTSHDRGITWQLSK